jgi:putative hemolysin
MRSIAARVLKPSKVLATIDSVKTALEKIDAEVKLYHYKIRNFEPHVKFSFERGHYLVKTAHDGAELEKCLKLRFEVFHREYMKKKRAMGVDVDRLDDLCDHLMIIDQRTEKVIGTYRLNSSLFNDTFYSAGEFEIGRVFEIPGNKLELGRACIDKDHRNGAVIALLWRGIAEYIQRTETVALFGCASIKTMDPLQIGLLTHHLTRQGHMDPSYGVVPTKKYKLRQFGKIMEYIEKNPYVYDPEEIERLVPTLLKSYLKGGARICGEPALDREFHCIDFLIVMKIEEMSAMMKGKYKV